MRNFIAKLFFTLSFVVMAQLVIAQMPKVEWDKTLGGSESDYSRVTIKTSDGGFLITGSSSSNASVDKSHDSRGSSDYWVVKLNGLGEKEWDKTLGGADDESLFTYESFTLQSSDGGFFIGSESKSNASGDKSENINDEDNDFWVVKLTGSGIKEWDSTLGGYTDRLGEVLQTKDGGYLVAGISDYLDKTAYYWTKVEKCNKNSDSTINLESYHTSKVGDGRIAVS